MEGIGERLREIRRKTGLNQGKFAAELGLKQGSYCDIENEKEILTPRNMEIICLKFGVYKEWLQNGTGPAFRPDELSFDQKEFIELYEKLDPEIQKEIRAYVKEKLELQELRKKSNQ